MSRGSCTGTRSQTDVLHIRHAFLQFYLFLHNEYLKQCITEPLLSICLLPTYVLQNEFQGFFMCVHIPVHKSSEGYVILISYFNTIFLKHDYKSLRRKQCFNILSDYPLMGNRKVKWIHSQNSAQTQNGRDRCGVYCLTLKWSWTYVLYELYVCTDM
jgi:hypothetical protein